MNLKPYLTQENIHQRISVLGKTISQDFRPYVSEDNPLVVICILGGSFMFTADLVREITIPVCVDFMKISSYGESTHSSGNVKIELDLGMDLSGKIVLVVEDIVDTGLSMTRLWESLKAKSPKEIKLCSLLFKPSRSVHKVFIDYLGFEIEDRFVVGYGLDLGGRFRELPYIAEYQE